MVKRVLMIAYHFPPMHGSSGIQRTLKFSQYLGEYGWLPTVLSAHPRSYPQTGTHQLGDIPPEVHVERAFALDTGKHLSFRKRYLRIMAVPDRYSSWWIGAVPAGLRLVRRMKPDVIWSTYPIATAHLIGMTLHRLTGILWVADMRDPMTDPLNPSNPMLRRVFEWIEKKTIEQCSRVVCTTPGAVRAYQERFPHVPAERFTLIPNGYDESNFAGAQVHAQDVAPLAGRPVTLVHSGIIYPAERNPTAFFMALSMLKAQGRISAASVQVLLRATVHDEYVEALASEHGISDLIKIAPRIAYGEALAEMLSADALLILQGANCNHQIPAKLYEYLRAGRPVLALTDHQGDTAMTLRAAGVDTIASLDSKDEIAAELLRFLELLKQDATPLASPAAVAAYSRRALTGQLGLVLDALVGEAGLAGATSQRRQAASSSKAP